jgi:hypothetical protein
MSKNWRLIFTGSVIKSSLKFERIEADRFKFSTFAVKLN